MGTVDGGFIELSNRFDSWDSCRAALTPPSFAGRKATDLEKRLRQSHPDWSDPAIAGAMANFEVRPNGSIAPWLTLDRPAGLRRATGRGKFCSRPAPSKIFATWWALTERGATAWALLTGGAAAWSTTKAVT